MLKFFNFYFYSRAIKNTGVYILKVCVVLGTNPGWIGVLPLSYTATSNFFIRQMCRFAFRIEVDIAVEEEDIFGFEDDFFPPLKPLYFTSVKAQKEGRLYLYCVIKIH